MKKKIFSKISRESFEVKFVYFLEEKNYEGGEEARLFRAIAHPHP